MLIAIFLGLFFLLPQNTMALEPSQVLVIANENSAQSLELASYYMKMRSIPQANILKLDVGKKEHISRSDYEKNVATPVRKFLMETENSPLRCLVTIYGMPLKIASPSMPGDEKKIIDDLEKKIGRLKKKIVKFMGAKQEKGMLEAELSGLKKKVSDYRTFHDRGSSLDSELSLVKKDKYDLSMWIPNPFFLPNRGRKSGVKKEEVILVSRLDGPSFDTVKRMIDDSIITEEKGLGGKAYFDARWPDPGDKKTSGYSLYDKSIHLAAEKIRHKDFLTSVKDDTARLFQPGDCPDAALYCGWYSLANYIDAFAWKRGAVGYHIASSECTTLKGKESRVWCKKMLEKGVAATLGPVGEPYVQAFPLPEIFFGFLTDGYLTLAECYFVSIPSLSWKMVLLGDPLYRPFKKFKGSR